MSISLKSVDALESKLTTLVERYTFLKEENEILISNINKLENMVSQFEERLTEEQEKYRLLKIAKTIEGSIADRRETKYKINTLIHEIDNCIMKLNQ
jgi:chromosome segregation ATPase